MKKYKVVENPKTNKNWEDEIEYTIKKLKKVLKSDKFFIEVYPDPEDPSQPLYLVNYEDKILEEKVKKNFSKYLHKLAKEFSKSDRYTNVMLI